MLEHLPDPSTKGGGLRPPPQRGGGLRPPPLCGSLCGWVWQVFKHQASSIKHQASSIKHQASSIKHQASSICFVTNQHTTEVEALLTRQISIIFRCAAFPNFEISRFQDLQVLNFENVEFARFGIINPVQNRLVSIRTVFWSLHNHKETRQNLNWAKKTKKFDYQAQMGVS